ncbi:MAG TPA: RluA family pseudouridine synthase, partial [Pirellulales bacterium]|nr:RluA family pseudouridine synthase [Pirellulales bacterium]
MSEIELLYESGACLVVRKPAGLATQAPAQFDSLEKRIRAWLAQREPRAEYVYLAVPHRLDRPVSGAMLFATRRRAAFKISRQFERREIKKIYWACVEGRVEPSEGTWTDHLRKIYGHPRAEVVDPEAAGAQLAVLRYRTLGMTPWGSWLEIELETGRTHQIRVQAASRGHAVLGDAFYGGSAPFGPQHHDERLRAIALHGRSLEFTHPHTGQRVTVTAEP